MAACIVALALQPACGPAVTTGHDPTVVPLASGSSSATASVELPAPDTTRAPPAIEGPAKTLCALRGRTGAFALELRLRPGDEAALWVQRPLETKVSLPPGPMLNGAFAEVRGPTASVRGWLNGRDVRVYPQKSLPFQGFAMPSNRTQMHWLEAKRGPSSARLKLAWEPHASIVGVDEIVDSVDCWDVSLDPGRFRADPGLGKVLYDGELTADRVPLAKTPGGDPVLHIVPGADGNRAVSVHVDTGPYLRVVYRADALYFGWVPKTMVRQTALSSIRTTGIGSSSRASHRAMQRKQMVERVCDEPIPLLLGSEDDAVLVGQLNAGVPFYAWRSTHRFRRLYLNEQWLVPQGDFELLTLAEHIDHTCHEPDAAHDDF